MGVVEAESLSIAEPAGGIEVICIITCESFREIDSALVRLKHTPNSFVAVRSNWADSDTRAGRNSLAFDYEVFRSVPKKLVHDRWQQACGLSDACAEKREFQRLLVSDWSCELMRLVVCVDLLLHLMIDGFVLAKVKQTCSHPNGSWSAPAPL